MKTNGNFICKDQNHTSQEIYDRLDEINEKYLHYSDNYKNHNNNLERLDELDYCETNSTTQKIVFSFYLNQFYIQLNIVHQQISVDILEMIENCSIKSELIALDYFQLFLDEFKEEFNREMLLKFDIGELEPSRDWIINKLQKFNAPVYVLLNEKSQEYNNFDEIFLTIEKLLQNNILTSYSKMTDMPLEERFL